MIQRKQTLFLLAVAIIGILLIFIPFQTFQDGIFNFPIRLFPDELGESNKYIVMSIDYIIIILSFITIFQYKNRVLQYKLANSLVLANITLLALFFLLNYVHQEAASYSFGAFLPIIGAIFAFLAGHFIKKDEQLVRSSDRIR
ncbi:MAG: DUF4293 domain-containing protein [Bacteroidota bacterium]